MRFRSVVLDDDGRQATAELEAADAQALHEQLHRDGRTLLLATPIAQAARQEAGNPRLPAKRMVLFLQSMQSALDAGVPLLSALSSIAEQEDDPRVAAMLADLGERVAGGQPLSEAMAAYPRSFPPVFCALVRAGEQSGSLPMVFESLAGFLEWRREVTGTVRTAMVYPVIVFTAAYALVLFLMAFVVPRLGEILSKIGAQLPAASRLLIAGSGFVAANIAWIVLGTALGIAGAVMALRTDPGRRLAAAVGTRLPIVRGIVQRLGIAQFCRGMAVLLQAGLTMTTALELAGATVDVPRTRSDVLRVRDAIVGGKKFAEAMGETELLSPVAMSMITVGEEAGRLPLMFERLARVQDREVKDAVKRALGLLEPCVTVGLGLVVGGVAVLVIRTIYTALQGIAR